MDDSPPKELTEAQQRKWFKILDIIAEYGREILERECQGKEVANEVVSPPSG